MYSVFSHINFFKGVIQRIKGKQMMSKNRIIKLQYDYKTATNWDREIEYCNNMDVIK